MEPKLVSIVVPVYNVEKYLDRCLNSIVSQTYRNLEILLVDDGSPDHCPALCEEWAKKDLRIRVIHKKNAGLGMARNTGMELATGDYLCFVDSDDYIAPDMVEKALAMAERTEAEIVIFGLHKVNMQGTVIQTLAPIPEQECFRGAEVQQKLLPDLIDEKNACTASKNLSLSACVCLFSMELIRATAWRFVSERQNISEDSYSLIWLYKYVSKAAVLPEAFYYYCDNAASLTRTYRADRFERIKGFYRDCTAMAAAQGYTDRVGSRIGGLYLAFSIAAMKQIVVADLPEKEKIGLIRQIVSDPVTRQVLVDPESQSSGFARKVLLWAMKGRHYRLVRLLAGAQTLRGK